MDTPVGGFTAIANNILVQAKALDKIIADHGLAAPTMSQWTLSDLTLDEEELRKSVIDGCHQLKLLASGPVGNFYDICFNVQSSTNIEHTEK